VDQDFWNIADSHEGQPEPRQFDACRDCVYNASRLNKEVSKDGNIPGYSEH